MLQATKADISRRKNPPTGGGKKRESPYTDLVADLYEGGESVSFMGVAESAETAFQEVEASQPASQAAPVPLTEQPSILAVDATLEPSVQSDASAPPVDEDATPSTSSGKSLDI